MHCPTERQLSGLKLVFAKVALDLPFPVPGGAGVDANWLQRWYKNARLQSRHALAAHTKLTV